MLREKNAHVLRVGKRQERGGVREEEKGFPFGTLRPPSARFRRDGWGPRAHVRASSLVRARVRCWWTGL